MASLTLDWIQLAAAVGALQGLLLTGVAIAQRNNQTAKRLLAALVASFTIYLASSVYYATGLIRVYPHFFGMSYQMPWIFGPLVYLYAVAASDRSWRFKRRHLLHFLPVAISVAIAAPYYFMSGADKIALFDRFVAGDVPTRLAIIDPFKFVSGIAYSIATFVYLRKHRRRIEDSYSNTARVNLAWLFWLAAAAAGIWVLATTIHVTLDGAPSARRARDARDRVARVRDGLHGPQAARDLPIRNGRVSCASGERRDDRAWADRAGDHKRGAGDRVGGAAVRALGTW